MSIHPLLRSRRRGYGNVRWTPELLLAHYHLRADLSSDYSAIALERRDGGKTFMFVRPSELERISSGDTAERHDVLCVLLNRNRVQPQ